MNSLFLQSARDDIDSFWFHDTHFVHSTKYMKNIQKLTHATYELWAN